MRPRYVVDTNVLIAASAVEATSPTARDATPADSALRQTVHDWLTEFDGSGTRMVLDAEGGINEEYGKKLGFNDYGTQVVIHKMSTSAVDWVDVLYDENGHGLLEEPLASIVHDRSDRKMVAAALDAIRQHGVCAVANAGETDWYDWEEGLRTAGLHVEQIIEGWSRAKWVEKRNR